MSAVSLTQDELLVELKARFGDISRWAFICPNCEDVATFADFAKALAEHPRVDTVGNVMTAGSVLGQECIGRTLGALEGPADTWTGRGCNWAAFGLIPGPLEVLLPSGRMKRAFHIAPAPVGAQ